MLSVIWINRPQSTLLPILACYGDEDRQSLVHYEIEPYYLVDDGHTINIDRCRQDISTFYHLFHTPNQRLVILFQSSFFIMGFAKFVPFLLLAAKSALADTPIAVSDFTQNGGLSAA